MSSSWNSAILFAIVRVLCTSEKSEISHLWHKNQAESACGTEYDEDGDNDKTSVLVLVQHIAHSYTQYTHYHNVVHGHTNILAVVQGRDLHVPCLPGQKCAKYLKNNARSVLLNSKSGIFWSKTDKEAVKIEKKYDNYL